MQKRSELEARGDEGMSWLLLTHLGNCCGENIIKQSITEENTCQGERKVKRRFLKTAV